MKLALLVVAVLAVLGSALVFPSPAPPPAAADHGELTDFEKPLIRSPVMRAWGLSPRGQIVEAGRATGGGIPALVRNLMTLTTSGTIPVCAPAAYATATQQAVAKWNTSLRANNVVSGRNILRYVAGGVLACPATSPPGQLANIIVLESTASHGCGHPGAIACANPGGIKDAPSFTYVGTTTLFFSESAFDDEFTFTGSDAAAKELAQKAAIIAHEIGHALGFPHPYEDLLGRPGDGRSRCPAVLSLTQPNIPAGLASLLLPGPCASTDLTSYDHAAYEQAYAPGKVASVAVTSASDTQLRVSWDDGDVHVAGSFLVQMRTTGDGVLPERWTTLATVPARTSGTDSMRSALVAKPVTETVFRVVSATDAFGTKAPLPSATARTIWTPPATYELHVTHGRNGDADPAGKTRQTKGATVEITADPDDGYMVDRWSGDCSGSETTCDVEMDGDKRVHVTFKAKPIVVPPTPEPKKKTKTCWDKSVIPVDQDCPAKTKTCWDKSVIPVDQDCPAKTKTCWDKSVIPVDQDCPAKTKTCWDKSVIPVDQDCPAKTKTCWDKSVIPVDQDCPAKTKTCWDESVIPVDQDCPAKTKTCPDKSVIPVGQDCPKPVVKLWGWNGACNSGSIGGGAGFDSSSAAASAGAAFVRGCPSGISSSLSSTTYWYANVTCANGTSFLLGPYGSSAAAASAGQGGLLACSVSGFSSRVAGQRLTSAELESHVRSALAAADSATTYEGLQASAERLTSEQLAALQPAVRGGGFETYRGEEDNKDYATVTCDDARVFEIGPAETLTEILDAAMLGLKVCANAEAVTGLSVTETVTPAQFTSAVTATLSSRVPPLTLDDLQEPPSGQDSRMESDRFGGRSGSFSISSSTTWGWSAGCNGSNASGSGLGYSSASAASNALALWALGANCPSGGSYRTYSYTSTQ